MATDPGRSASLDAIRGIAILGVVAVHSAETAEEIFGSSSLVEAAKVGRFGVQLFFVLSGYLIFSLYDRSDRWDARVYFRRRLARIWPLWAVFIVVSAVLYPYFSEFLAPRHLDPGISSLGSVALALAFLGWLSAPIWAVLPPGGWSIQSEVAHYLIFPLLRNRSKGAVLATVLGLQVLTLIGLLVAQATGISWFAEVVAAWMRLGFYNTVLYFVAGGLIFMVVRRMRDSTAGSKMVWSVSPLTAALGLAVTVLAVLIPTYFHTLFFVAPWEPVGFVVVAGAVALALQVVPGVGTALCSMGRYSYFMYFCHFWVLWGLATLLMPWLISSGMGATTAFFGFFIVAGGISFGLGTLSWRFFERPILRFVG